MASALDNSNGQSEVACIGLALITPPVPVPGEGLTAPGVTGSRRGGGLRPGSGIWLYVLGDADDAAHHFDTFAREQGLVVWLGRVGL